MADVTITGLPNAATLTGTERVPMDQGGATVDAPASAIAALATKATVGLGNCDNTSDLAKPISTATQAALNLKASPEEAAAAAPVQSVSFSAPSGWSASSNNTDGNVALTLALPVGFSLPSNTSQAGWDAAAVLAGTAVQPAALASTLTNYVQTGDVRLSDSREWSAATVAQATAEAGISTTRVAYNPLRVFQSIAAYIAANFSATGQALASAVNAAAARTALGLGSAATAATGDFAAASHSQAASTISDSTATGRAVLTAADAAAARSAIGAGTSSLAVSSAAPAALAATAAAGTSTDAAPADHAHQRDPDLLVVNLSGSASDPTAANTIETFRFTFAAEILASELSSETVASGSAFQVNARLNASSIYSVRPQIAIGSTAGSSGTLAITAAAIGDVLRFDISQAGGGCRLAKLYLTIRRTA